MPSQRNKPGNWREAQDALVNPRLSLSPSRLSDGAFDRFCEIEAKTRNENDVITEIIPILLGEKRRDYPSAGDVPFGNMEDMAPDIFKKPKPDLYWGARPEQIDRQVKKDLNHQIVPSTRDIYPAVPNLFLEVKGPNGLPAKRTMQACYIGSMGARAMHALQCYGQVEPIYDNNAYTFSSTYQEGILKIYSHHPAPPSRPGESPRYHMTQLNSYALTGDIDTLRRGVGALRNARDLAREQRDMLINEANAVARAQSADMMSFNGSNSQDTITSLRGRSIDSDTSADELSLDHPSTTSRTKRRKKREETCQPPRTTTAEVQSQQVFIGSTPDR